MHKLQNRYTYSINVYDIRRGQGVHLSYTSTHSYPRLHPLTHAYIHYHIQAHIIRLYSPFRRSAVILLPGPQPSHHRHHCYYLNASDSRCRRSLFLKDAMETYPPAGPRKVSAGNVFHNLTATTRNDIPIIRVICMGTTNRCNLFLVQYA